MPPAGYGATQWDALAAIGSLLPRALGQLKTTGELTEDPALVAPFAERQRLVNKPMWDALEQRYAH